MRGTRVGSCVGVGCLVAGALAQDEAETCYGPGSVVGAVVGTLIVTVGLLASAFFFYKMYWKNRKGKHLVLMTDVENPQDQYAFDNPCFREASPIKHIQEDKHSTKIEKTKWPGWPPIHTFGKDHKTEKMTSMDDSYLKDSRLKVVTLKSHDFTGLGFNICGNMRDGIFVKDVLHRGPAFESGCVSTGDRIDSVCISFRNMVFEDALTILSYASPYDVQVQLENDSFSRPSTLMRSKRESNAVNCSNRILHPKFSRSQSVSHLNEIGNSNNKKLSHQIGLMMEKNRVNHALNKSQEFCDYPTIKVSSPEHKTTTHKVSPDRDHDSQQTKSLDSQNKLHKFGIKVLPVNINPKMGVQSVTGEKKKTATDTNAVKEKPEKSAKQSRNTSPVDDKLSETMEEADASKESTKGLLAKGFFGLKEKINQNSLVKKKKGEEEESSEEAEGAGVGGGSECPIPRRRSSVTCGVKAYERNQQSQMNVPEEVFRAGDMARSNRKSVVEGRKFGEELEGSDSEGCSDRESGKDETKRPKRSKGKAPSPPKPAAKEMNEIKSESEVLKEESSIFEPESKVISLKEEEKEGRRDEEREEEEEEKNSRRQTYDSDSDAEPMSIPKDSPGTKIELNATQVTVHHSPAGDANDEEVEPSRKAASLGDLSKLDSEQPLSIVLERAVSLDLTEGTSQCGKKRKAPLPPSEEFPAVFDELNYRKEPRLEGLNTFQRRLKKSSDFGTLEDALNQEPKALEIEVNKLLPHDLSQAHSYNIQEFSSWLAECRKPKGEGEEGKSNEDKTKISSTSLINISAGDSSEEEKKPEDKYEFQVGNVSFRVNGKNFPDFEVNSLSDMSPNSRTVVVISQPNSLEPPVLEKESDETSNGPTDPEETEDSSPPKLPTTPMPTQATLSSPLSSPLTYVTEIKVSTPEQNFLKTQPDTPSPNSVAERIHRFDSFKGINTKILNETPKIPIKTMKSETGQRVLATIQSLAKESSTKTPEVEYAKRVTSLFSNPHRNEDASETDVPRPNVSGFYFKTSPPKPSKDYSPSRKVPPVVPPRKIETVIPNKSTVTLGLPTPPSDSQERNIVTFSSFVGRTQTDNPSPSKISFNVKQQEEMNGGQDELVAVRSSATKIVLDGQEEKDEF